MKDKSVFTFHIFVVIGLQTERKGTMILLVLALLIGIIDINSIGNLNCSFRRRPEEEINLCEIPDILVGQEQPLITRATQNPLFYRFWDSESTRKCLANKQLLFLGDSTMEETIDDLNILLSGIGSQNVSTFGSYLFESSLASHIHPPYKRIDLPRNITVEYFGGRRNMTVTSNVLGLRVRYRFTGHHHLFRNYEGILTFFHPDFSAEFDCLLGGNGCMQPSIIVINSGLHDSRGHNNASLFALYLNKLLAKFQEQPSTKRIIWKSNLISEEIVRIHHNLPLFNDLARNITQQRKLQYVNSTLAYDIVAQGAPYLLRKTSTDNFLHIGSIAKDKFHRERYHRKPYSWHSLAMSSLSTQLLLSEICQ